VNRKKLVLWLPGFFCIMLIWPLFLFAGTVDLPKTGQSTCYDASGYVIDCAGTGQDGDIQAGVDWPEPRFEDNENGTITDRLTGLIWLKNVTECPLPMNWYDALNYCNNLKSGTCGLNDGSVAGDWRLPNIIELESLVNSEELFSFAWLNSYGFSIDGGAYWSSTTRVNNTYFVLTMCHGFMSGGYKLDFNSVWPVRAGAQAQPAQTWKTGQTTCYDAERNVIDCAETGQDGDIQAGVDWPEPRFEDNGDGTITDHLTGLIWLKNANCAGSRMNWNDALTYCNNLANGSCILTDGSAAGDWRLPNKKELLSLIDYSRYLPALPQWHLFDNVQSSYYYWSATTNATDTDYAWDFSMGLGHVSHGSKSGSNYVWPVRTGQGGSPNDAILTDNFNDNSIDPEKWSIRIGGVRTAEEDGIMKIEQAATDNGGVLYSEWLDISPGEVITIERMAKVHYSNNYFGGGVSLEIEGVSEPIFVINYANYAYSTYPYQSRYGFFISRNGTNPYRSDQNPDDTSERIEPVWDTWFNEKVIYDPITGLLEYYINNFLQLTFNVGNLPELGLSNYRMQLTFSTWGWWTGHYHYMDDIIIYQEHSGDNLTISSPVIGPIGVVDTIEDCQGLYNEEKWCFNQHKSGFHSPGGGINGSDDTYAWDINLNSPVWDSDKNKPVYAIADGVVEENYAGAVNAGGSAGQLLIRHDTNGLTWWSGYLHLSNILVNPGDTVTKDDILGQIGSTGTDNNHLHFVMYAGENVAGGLVSFDSSIVQNGNTLQLLLNDFTSLFNYGWSDFSHSTPQTKVSISGIVQNCINDPDYRLTLGETEIVTEKINSFYSLFSSFPQPVDYVCGPKDDGTWDTGTIITPFFDATWGDDLNSDSKFNTVYAPAIISDKFEVISRIDDGSTPFDGTTNESCYFFTYDSLNDGTASIEKIDRWVNYLEDIVEKYKRSIDTLTIFAHGKPGKINMSDSFAVVSDPTLLHEPPTQEDLNDVQNIEEQFRRLRDKTDSGQDFLSDHATILLFVCNAGQDETGNSFIKNLANWTGAIVYANTEATGNIKKDGNRIITDWDLDVIGIPDDYFDSPDNSIYNIDVKSCEKKTVMLPNGVVVDIEAGDVEKDGGTLTVSNVLNQYSGETDVISAFNISLDKIKEGQSITVTLPFNSDVVNLNDTGLTVNFWNEESQEWSDEGIWDILINENYVVFKTNHTTVFAVIKEAQTVPTVIEVTIDIKPGSDPNCFNNDGHGVIPLAILGSADFDCTQIDPTTCTLSGLTLKIAGKSNKLMAHIEDVNNDGFDDLVLQIEDQDGAFQVGEAEATLNGNLYEAYGGTPIQGTDSICIVP